MTANYQSPDTEYQSCKAAENAVTVSLGQGFELPQNYRRNLLRSLSPEARWWFLRPHQPAQTLPQGASLKLAPWPVPHNPHSR